MMHLLPVLITPSDSHHSTPLFLLNITDTPSMPIPLEQQLFRLTRPSTRLKGEFLLLFLSSPYPLPNVQEISLDNPYPLINPITNPYQFICLI